jgi:hypothetical protein
MQLRLALAGKDQEQTMNAPTRSSTHDGLAIEAAAGQFGAPRKAGKSKRGITSFRGAPAVSQLMIHKSKTNVLFGRIWPTAAVVCGLGLTAAWALLLGYVFISLIMRAYWAATIGGVF